ncbi:MAG: cysteine-rich CWC family protein [bacterium]
MVRDGSTSNCPLCGGANQCRMAAGDDDVAECWCRDRRIPNSVLGRIPQADRGVSCVCARCASQDDGGFPNILPVVIERLARIRRNR